MPSSPSAAGASPSDSDELLQEYLELWADKGIDAVRSAASENGPLSKRLEVLQDLEDLAAALDPGDRSVLDPPEELKLDHLDRFEALELIGIGGLARVYRAYDPELSRQVALKVFDSSRWVTESSLNWILNEGRTIARLDHPGVVRVYEVGQHDGLAFMAMELIEGPSLQDLLDFFRGTTEGEASEELQVAAGRLTSIRARCKLLRTIADTLAYGHSQGIVHRDVKPANVLLAKDGTPKLIDFGLAHLPESGSLTDVTERLVGTPAYVAPEQVDSGQTGADPKSDQFSLGVLMYELLTLENPFERGTRAETMAAVSRAAPPRPRRLNRQIPAPLETVCLHALEAQPSRRYPDVGALVADLDAYLENRAISLGSSGPTAVRLWLRRNRGSLLRVAALGVLLVGTLVGRGAWESYWAVRAQRSVLASLELQPSEHEPLSFDQLSSALETLEETYALIEREEGSVSVRSQVRDLARTAEELLLGLSGELSQAIGSDYERAQSDTLTPDLTARLKRMAFNRWDGLLSLERSLFQEACRLADDNSPGDGLPDLSHLPTRDHRTRSTFTLPSAPPGQRIELRALEMTPPTFYSTPRLVDRQPERAGEGVYRVSCIDDRTGRIESEVNVYVHLGEAEQHIAILPVPEPSTFTIALESPVVDFVDMHHRDQTVQLAPFELSPLVTWEEVSGVLPDAIVEHARSKNPETRFAILSLEQARTYAQRRGARLPSLLELREAHMEQYISMDGTGLKGEWAAEPFSGDLSQAGSYHAHAHAHAPSSPGPDPELPDTAILYWMRGYHASGLPSKVGFRLARTIRYDD